MRRLAFALGCIAGLVPLSASAADLDPPPPPPQRAPALVVGDVQLCRLGAPIDVYTAPATASNGRLLPGLLVEIVDRPFDPMSDLWVRLRAPRGGEYYGYVATADLSCV